MFPVDRKDFDFKDTTAIKSLQIAGLTPGEIVEEVFLFFDVPSGLTRGSGAFAKSWEQIAQMVSNLEWTPPKSKLRVNANGRDLAALNNQLNGKRQGYGQGAAETALKHVLPIPLEFLRGRKEAKEYLPTTDEIENSNINLTLDNSIYNFTATSGDFDDVSFDGAVEVYVKSRPRLHGEEGKRTAPRPVIISQSDYDGRILRTPGVACTQLVVWEHDDWSRATLSIGGRNAYSSCPREVIDAIGAKHRVQAIPEAGDAQVSYAEAPTSNANVCDFPIISSQAAAYLNGVVFFDARDFPHLIGEAAVVLNDRTSATQYEHFYAGYSMQ